MNGSSVKRTLVASRRAFANAGATALYGLSLTDFAPSGPIESSVDANTTFVGGTSANVGTPEALPSPSIEPLRQR